MSQYHADNFQQTRRVRMNENRTGWSKLAITAAGLSVIAWALPLLPVLALVLAVVAWKSIQQSHQQSTVLRGKALVAFACALGFVGIGLQGFVGYRGVAVYKQLSSGPIEAVARGSAGDVDTFLAAFEADPGQRAAAEQFLAELETRYGTFIQGSIEETPLVLEALQDNSVSHRYQIQFSQGQVTAEAQLAPQTAAVLPTPPRLQSLTIDDAEHGPLSFPATQISVVVP